jgi:hypothetical protein
LIFQVQFFTSSIFYLAATAAWAQCSAISSPFERNHALRDKEQGAVPGRTISGTPPVHAAHFRPATGFGTPTHFPGGGLALAVNAGGTALLASEVTSAEGTFFGISIRAAMFRP